jgi:putative sterol carrier protein
VTDIQPYVERMVARFAEAATQNAALPARVLQFTFTDTQDHWVIRYGDGRPAVGAQEIVEQPDVAVTATTDVMAGIMDKKINGAMAYMQRKIQVKGAMEDLLKLQKIIM